jgi:hypothetical protein
LSRKILHCSFHQKLTTTEKRALNNQSEVVREALRRREAEDRSYLNPPPLTPAQLEEIYGPNPEAEAREKAFGRAAFDAVRRAAHKGRKP